MIAVDTRRRKAANLSPESVESEETEVRRLLAEAEAELAEIDEQIGADEVIRDNADATVKEIRAAGGSALGAWKAEEERAAAEARITGRIPERTRVNLRRTALAAAVAPIDQGREKAAQIRRAIAGWRKLAEALQKFDEFAALFAEAEIAGRGSAGHFPKFPTLSQVIRNAGPDAYRRDTIRQRLDTLDELEALAARLEVGALR